MEYLLHDGLTNGVLSLEDLFHDSLPNGGFITIKSYQWSIHYMAVLPMEYYH